MRVGIIAQFATMFFVKFVQTSPAIDAIITLVDVSCIFTPIK